MPCCEQQLSGRKIQNVTLIENAVKICQYTHSEMEHFVMHEIFQSLGMYIVICMLVLHIEYKLIINQSGGWGIREPSTCTIFADFDFCIQHFQVHTYSVYMCSEFQNKSIFPFEENGDVDQIQSLFHMTGIFIFMRRSNCCHGFAFTAEMWNLIKYMYIVFLCP